MSRATINKQIQILKDAELIFTTDQYDRMGFRKGSLYHFKFGGCQDSKQPLSKIQVYNQLFNQ